MKKNCATCNWILGIEPEHSMCTLRISLFLLRAMRKKIPAGPLGLYDKSMPNMNTNVHPTDNACEHYITEAAFKKWKRKQKG